MTDGVLLIHAFPLDARMWEPQLSSFGGLAVVAPHLPGFGGTPGAGDVMTMGAAAERCLAALDAAGVDRAVVCGLSMGGYVAFELWRQARERFAGLLLANTRAGADSDEGAAGRRALAARLMAEGSDFLVESPPPLLSEGASDDLRAPGTGPDRRAAGGLDRGGGPGHGRAARLDTGSRCRSTCPPWWSRRTSTR